MITISLLSSSFPVLENNQFSNMSEQAKMGLFSSAMQTLRQTLSLRPKSGISGVIKSFCVQLERIRISAFLFSPSDLSCFCFCFFFCLPFSSFDGLSATLNTFLYFLQRGEAAPVVPDRHFYLLLVLHLKWRNMAFLAIWRARLPQRVKSSPQTLLSWQLRREESP